MTTATNKINESNFSGAVLNFRDRQAGIGVVYDPELDRFFYNVYCIDTTLLKELYTCEYEFLSEAIGVLNSEFGSWDLKLLEDEKGCGSCVAK